MNIPFVLHSSVSTESIINPGGNLTSSEYINTDLEKIIISTVNEEFNGFDKYDDIFLNPYKTDKEIERIKKRKGENINDLENIIG